MIRGQCRPIMECPSPGSPAGAGREAARMARPKRQDARRDELVAATQRAILKSGPDGVKLNRVAAEAGLTSGAVLYYYPDIDELVLEANRVGMERFYDDRLRMI